MPIQPDRITRGGSGTRGPLIAEFVVFRASGNRSRSSEYGSNSGRWNLTEFGLQAGFAVDDARLTAPSLRPEGVVSLEAVGGEEVETSVLPWFGELHNLTGIGGAIVAVGEGERLSVRLHQAESPREVRIAGADTGVSVGARLCLYAVYG